MTISKSKTATIKLLDQYFTTAFSAPEGIPKLRELILSLAMRGQLVPQNPDDIPARDLLKDIETEKQRLIDEKKLKKSKPLPEITADEIPYDIPDSWQWVRLGDIFQLKSGYSFSKQDEIETGDFIYLKVGEMNLVENEIYIKTSSIYLKESEKVLSSLIPANSIIFPKRGGAIATNKKRLVTQPICVDTNIMSMICPRLIDLQFAYHWILSIDLARLNSGTSVPQINNKDLNPLLFPLPPLEEQERIVEKIETLMEKCDRLEKLHQEKEAKRLKIQIAVGDKLLKATDKKGFDDAWQFMRDNFETIYSVKENVKQLRQIILQLAVMGKLAPQDDNDKPAQQLLKDIEAEKQQLIKEGKIKKQKPLPEITPDEIPYDIPDSWEWVRLGDSMLKVTDGTHKSPINIQKGDFLYISAKNIKNEGISLDNVTYVTKEIHETIYSRCNPEFGDILYIKDGATTGIATINNLKEQFSMLSSVALIKQPRQIYNKFLLLSLKSPFFYKEIRADMSGVAITRVTLKKIKAFIVPLPPLEEQRRIVEKVDKMMKLCDELEEKITNQTEKQTSLLNALIAQI
ncbi:type I site-specific restriction-modification system HsdS family specificity subunit [Cyanobacterium sp. HL-69]|uniref:restriction endonuclease subunit S n=1 Tax=Cyanobacterium sp. HL-69 TaxID=2054282 RepID=UPI000CA368A3|nr:type I site-specific restriction-modification system HsdS family specificity subunit [Cyanobacterium sp. HL-69]